MSVTRAIGNVLAILLVLAGQLIWILDPLRIAQGMYWIDMIDYLVYICLLPPILWMFSAVKGLRMQNQKHSLIVMRIVIIASSAVGVYCIIFAQQHLVIMGIGLAIAFLLGLVVMFIETWSEHRRLVFSMLVTTLILLVVLLWPTSYMVTYPGLTVNMHRYALAEGVDNIADAASGEIMGVLVFERPAFPIDWLYARLFEHYEFRKIQPTDLPLGDQLQLVRLLKHDANQVGAAIAFEKAGLGQGVTSHGARIVATLPDTPAAEQLLGGDVIVQLNNDAIHTVADLIEHTGEMKPGEQLHLVVKRGDKHIAITIKTDADPANPDRAVIGVQIMDETKLDLPRNVFFESYLLHEGGPSHGAMLALTLIDQLTPGGIMNGNIVAGTGTIELDGTIGWIGGIKQKAFTVERGGAEVFFVPMGQQEEARKGATHLNIVPVETLEHILQWLADNPRQ